MVEKRPGGKTIGAVETACEIMEWIVASDGAAVSELMEAQDLSRSSIHNHLRTLEKFGYVHSVDGEYHVGIATLTLGGYAREKHSIYQTGRPVVDQLAEKTGELALLTIPDRGQSVYLYHNNGSDAVTYDSHTGVRLLMHCTATGKAMLAEQPEEYVDNVIKEYGLPERTENTITDRETLDEEFSSIRESGIAFDDEERIEGMRGVAVPVKNRETEELLGAISVAGPTSRFHGEKFESTVPDLLRRNAQMLEVDISY